MILYLPTICNENNIVPSMVHCSKFCMNNKIIKEQTNYNINTIIDNNV